MDDEEAIITALAEMAECLGNINARDTEACAKDILETNTVFVAGAGRALFQLRCFAKRLSQIGISVHVIGDTTAAPIVPGDLLIIASCSGKTMIPLAIAAKAKEIGARLWAITASPESPVTKHCDRVLLIPCCGYRQDNAKSPSVQPMNNLFEQALHIVLDTVSWRIQEAKGVSGDDLCSRHANIE